MFCKSIIILGLAALVLAEPIPQAAATTDQGSSPSALSAALASESAAAASIESAFSGMPTLPSSVLSVLVTAIPTGVYTGQQCQTTTPAWYYSLPADVKSAISSYDDAFASWYKIHSTDFGPDQTATLPANICAGTVFLTQTGAATLPTATGALPTVTGKVSATATGKSASASAGSSSSSKAAAPRATGTIGASVAGLVGVFGFMLAL
jgi:hypothetical protein